MAVLYTGTVPNCMSYSCGTGTKHLFPCMNVVCVPCLTGVRSWDQGWVSVFITLLIKWVGLVCKLRILHACHLVICKGGLVVGVASIAVIVMATHERLFLSSWLSWTRTKTLDLLKDQIQVEVIEKCLEKNEQDGELKENRKRCVSRMMT